MPSDKESNEQKSGIFHSLWEGVANILTEEAQGQGQATSGVSKPASVAVPGSSTLAVKEVPADSGVDEKAYKAIIRSVGKRGSELETFTDMVKILSEDITDEATLYRSSIKALKAQGIDAKIIIQAIVNQIGALPDEKSKFDSYASSKDTEIKDQEKAIEQIVQQIEALHQKIQDMQADMETKKSKLDSDRSTVDETRRRFEATLAKVESDLFIQKEKVVKYLMGGK